MSTPNQTKTDTPTSNFFEPWMRAAHAWTSESEKIQQSALDGIYRAIDNSHALVKEGVGLVVSAGTSMQKQINAQFDRTCSWLSTMLP